MSILEWAFDATAQVRASEERRKERARGAVARAQLKSLRRQKRRDTRIRMIRWVGRHKMAVYPLAFVGCVATGLFTVSVLAGWVALGVGALVIEWRVSQ